MSDPTRIPMPHTSHDPVPALLPRVLRVERLKRERVEGGIACKAVLYHDSATLYVHWLDRREDERLKPGVLVTIRWLGMPTSQNGAIRIQRLSVLDRPEADLDLFATVPHDWVSDRTLVKRASALTTRLEPGFRALVNAVLWDGERLHRFVSGPSSMNGHHSEWNGNFRHAIETAEIALEQGRAVAMVSQDVLLTAALLHDAGKADEYRVAAGGRRFELTDRGVLVGHRHTILEWLAVARGTSARQIDEAHYLSLLHALTAAKGAEWLGVREPVSLEATLLQVADRISGQVDLVGTHAPTRPGFGRYHRHLRGRPYVLGAVARGED